MFGHKIFFYWNLNVFNLKLNIFFMKVRIRRFGPKIFFGKKGIFIELPPILPGKQTQSAVHLLHITSDCARRTYGHFFIFDNY